MSKISLRVCVVVLISAFHLCWQSGARAEGMTDGVSKTFPSIAACFKKAKEVGSAYKTIHRMHSFKALKTAVHAYDLDEQGADADIRCVEMNNKSAVAVIFVHGENQSSRNFIVSRLKKYLNK